MCRSSCFHFFCFFAAEFPRFFVAGCLFWPGVRATDGRDERVPGWTAPAGDCHRHVNMFWFSWLWYHNHHDDIDNSKHNIQHHHHQQKGPSQWNPGARFFEDAGTRTGSPLPGDLGQSCRMAGGVIRYESVWNCKASKKRWKCFRRMRWIIMRYNELIIFRCPTFLSEFRDVHIHPVFELRFGGVLTVLHVQTHQSLQSSSELISCLYTIGQCTIPISISSCIHC